MTEAALRAEHLSGISDAEFDAAKAAFVTVEGVDDGLGPIFNDVSCGKCHDAGAVGGAGTSIERRFGRFENGRFNPLAEDGGSLRQLRTLGKFTNAQGKRCDVPLERESKRANVRNVGRLTTPLFGLGLVDAMPDAFFEDLANSEPQKLRGRINRVNVLLPDPADDSQSVGGKRVGRFGWKAGVATLVQFAADAYLNEMGITTRHCIAGKFVDSFTKESAPNGTAVDPSCEDNKPGVDDSVDQCKGNDSEIQDDVAQFTKFMTFLAPPDPSRNARSNRDGERLFSNTGCGDCHTTRTFRTPNNPANGVPGRFSFRPFSDFLVHDMGSLGDRIGNAGDSEAVTRRMRTAPLWGLRLRPRLLHDGRATDVEDAIDAHDGEAADAKRAFDELGRNDQQRLVKFVSGL